MPKIDVDAVPARSGAGCPAPCDQPRAGRTRTRRTLLLGVAATVCATLAGAQDGRGGRFDDDLFANLEGEWLVTRSIGGREVRNTASAAWVLQHQFLLLRLRDVAVPPRYEADVYIGYSHARGEYVAHWLDNFGGHFSALGRGKRRGNAVEFRFDYPDGPFFNTFAWDAEAGTWSCHLQSVGPEGARSTFARDTLTRRH